MNYFVMLPCPCAALWQPMKSMFLFSTQGFIKYTNCLSPVWYILRPIPGKWKDTEQTFSLRALKATLYCYWKKVTMAMIFSRQVKVWTGTLLKHHLFLVGNGCGILVNSIPLRLGCVGKEGLSRRCIQHSRKGKKYHYMIRNTGNIQKYYTLCTYGKH